VDKFFRYIFLLIFFISQVLSAQTASRTVDGVVIYYDSLHGAFEAALTDADGKSPDAPGEIILLTNITLDAPLIVENGQHIRLVAGNNITIMRGYNFVEYPLLWITGDLASLTLGAPGMGYTLSIDGGFLNNPPVHSHSPLVAINGQDSKLIMYDNVVLQNNHNFSTVPVNANLYQNGGAVFIRQSEDNFYRLSEFIMKGGIIRGNANKTRPNRFGGAVLLNIGIFIMEGGAIMDNTTQLTGAGVHLDSRSSFYKTGGIIYGINAPLAYRNTAIVGYTSSKIFGHAVSVELSESPGIHFRDDTVKENEVLSYSGANSGKGIFGKGERWDNPSTKTRRYLLIAALLTLVLSIPAVIIIRKKIIKSKLPRTGEKTKARLDAEKLLTHREKEVFDMFISGHTARKTAQSLQLSISSINFHSQNIYRKLDIQSRAELLVKYK
jgi:DNA-binding CsgD family transcriptional regulator